jgi:hypothetical protein
LIYEYKRVEEGVMYWEVTGASIKSKTPGDFLLALRQDFKAHEVPPGRLARAASSW